MKNVLNVDIYIFVKLDVLLLKMLIKQIRVIPVSYNKSFIKIEIMEKNAIIILNILIKNIAILF
jgi:hypothetical protein